MTNPVIIFGAKGLGKVALEIFKSHEIIVYGFLEEDESLHGTEIDYVSVLGNPEDAGFLKLIGKKCDAFIASDENSYRKSLVEMLQERRKTMPVNAIHSNSFIAASASIGHGNMFNMGVRIGANASIGHHCILQANALVDYDCKLGNFVQVGAGSIINSGVEIGEDTFIGSGVTVVSGVKIGKNARIGAGSVVIQSVEEGKTVFGNPAQPIRS